MLNKTDICRELSASTGLGANTVKHLLDDLAELAGEQLEIGEDFLVPGICKISFRYTSPAKKGEKFKKGETVTNPFTGEERVADADSPSKRARVTLGISPLGYVRKHKPGTKPEVQTAFLKTKAGKWIVRRLSK